MDVQNITAAVEGILFASGEPIPMRRLAGILEIDDRAVEYAIVQLEAHYNDGERGIRLLRMEDSVQLCSAPEYVDVIRLALEKRRIPQLSPTALEVLAIVAYFQPVTRAYVEKVRGVDSSYTMSTLQARGLIESCGQLQVLGRPTLFQTTNAFLRTFDLTKLSDLPPLPEAEDSETKERLQEAIAAIQREQEEKKQAEAVAQELRDSLFQDEEPVAEETAEVEAETELEE